MHSIYTTYIYDSKARKPCVIHLLFAAYVYFSCLPLMLYKDGMGKHAKHSFLPHQLCRHRSLFPSSNPRPPPTSKLCPSTSPQLSSRGRRVVGGIKSFPISGNYGSFSAHKSSYSFHALFSPPLHHSSLSLSSPPPSISHPLFSHPFSLFLLHFLGR